MNGECSCTFFTRDPSGHRNLLEVFACKTHLRKWENNSAETNHVSVSDMILVQSLLALTREQLVKLPWWLLAFIFFFFSRLGRKQRSAFFQWTSGANRTSGRPGCQFVVTSGGDLTWHTWNKLTGKEKRNQNTLLLSIVCWVYMLAREMSEISD